MLNRRRPSDGRALQTKYMSPSKSESVVPSKAAAAAAATPSPLPPPKPASRSSSSSSNNTDQVTPYSTYAGNRYSRDHVTADLDYDRPALSTVTPMTTDINSNSPPSPVSPLTSGRRSTCSSITNNRIKAINRASINESLGRPLDRLCVQMGEGFVKRDDEEEQHQDMHLTKARLEKTCDFLRQQRDSLISEVQDYFTGTSSSPCPIDEDNGNNDDDEGKKQRQLWERLQQLFDEQLKSIQADIQEAKSEYEKLNKARDEIMDEMVLLNTKNAELNAMNNDLSRRVSEREQEAVAFMAGTNFLDNKDKKPNPRSNDTCNVTPTLDKKSCDGGGIGEVVGGIGEQGLAKIKKLKNRSLMFGKFGNKQSSSPQRKSSSSNNWNGSFTNGNGDPESPYPLSESGSTSTIPDTRSISSTDNNSNSNHGESITANDEHSLYQTKFIRPVRCEICGDKIWRTPELKCQGCGVTCHFRCMRNLPQECPNMKKSDSRHRSMSTISTKSSVVFGNDLGKQVQLENSEVPLIVRSCVEAVEARGMDVEGIYRKSGGAKQMREIQQLFDQGQVPDLTDENHWNDINAVTSVLKQYFRKLPDPLFTYQFHNEFIKSTNINDPTERFEYIRSLIHNSLPLENRNTIRYLMRHLYRIQERCDVNYMNTRNLAVIFGPTLLRNLDEASDLLEMNRKIETIDYLLNHCNQFFGCSDDKKEEKEGKV